MRRSSLTIDPKAQAAADKALGDNKGAVVALDPKTGAILAMVSHPSYDPNPLSSHDLNKASKAWQTLSNDKDKAYLNRTINGVYPPGSTFKVVTAAAALENGVVSDENSTVPGPASLDLPLTSTNLPNEDGRACGPNDETTLIHALEISCNTAFGSLGLEPGRREDPGPGRQVRLRRRAPDPDARLGEPRSRPTSTPRSPRRPRSASTTCARRRSRWPWSRPASPTRAGS